jgi:hypothetical protein
METELAELANRLKRLRFCLDPTNGLAMIVMGETGEIARVPGTVAQINAWLDTLNAIGKDRIDVI